MTVKDDTNHVKIKPIIQEFFKLSSGGMAALSSGILALWFTSEKVPEGKLLMALTLIGFSIPLLVFSRGITHLFDAFEGVTKKASRLADILYWMGMSSAYLGYFFVLNYFSILISLAFLTGVSLSIGVVSWIIREFDKPGMNVKSASMGRRPIPRHGRVDLGELSPTVPAPSDGA